MIKSNLSTLLEKKGINAGERVEKLRHRYWDPREESEKKGIIIAAVFLIAAGYLWGIWQPVNLEIAQQQSAQQQLELLQRKLEVWNKSRKARKSPPAAAEDMPDYLAKIIIERAEKDGVMIEDINVEEAVISVDVKPMAFSALLRWLNQLREEEGFMVSHLAVIATKPGVIAVQQLELVYQP